MTSQAVQPASEQITGLARLGANVVAEWSDDEGINGETSVSIERLAGLITLNVDVQLPIVTRMSMVRAALKAAFQMGRAEGNTHGVDK